MPNICVLTPTEDYEEDWSVLEAGYRRLFGDALTFRCWTDPGDLSGFDLVSPLIAWGYQRGCPAWYALLDRMEREGVPVCNPISVLRWNSDKSYLAELAMAGIATAPTRMSEALDTAALNSARMDFATDTLIVKPPVSGGADGTFRIGPDDAVPASVAGQRMMIQPFMQSVATEGEYSLFYFDGVYSHAIIKRPANGDFRVQDKFGGYEEVIEATDAAKALAEASLAATAQITDTGTLAYARADMLRDVDGSLKLVELELIEPSLFLQFARDGGASFFAALCKHL